MINRLIFHNDIVQEQYDPSVNLMNSEFSLESIVAKVNALIQLNCIESPSKNYQLVTLSFSKIYLTSAGPKPFLAHVSPLVVSKRQDKVLLFIFDEAAREIAKKVVDSNEVVCVYHVKGLIQSLLNCNIFSLSIIKQFARDPEMLDYISEKNPPKQKFVEVPLLPPYLPSKLMRFSESVKDKLRYLSLAKVPILNHFINITDILKIPCVKATLVKVQGIIITAQEKTVSTLLYQKNIKYALKLNQHEIEETRLQTQLSKELKVLTGEETTIHDVLSQEVLAHSIPSLLTRKEVNLEQSNQYKKEIESQILFNFFEKISSRQFMCVFQRDLPKDFQSFSEAFTLDVEHQLFSFFDFFDNFRYPPTELLSPDYYKVPLRGLMYLLGVSRSIADINALSELGKSVGFVWLRNELGEIIAAQTVKVVDGSYPFIFEKKKEQRCTHSLLINTQQQLGSLAMWLKDIRDIQTEVLSVTKDRPRVASWKDLLSEQQEEFKEGMCAAYCCIKKNGLLEGLKLDPITLRLAENYQKVATNWIEEQIKIYS